MTPYWRGNWGGRAVKVLEDSIVHIQKLEEWAARNCTRPILHLGRNNLRTGVQAAKSTLVPCESPVCKPSTQLLHLGYNVQFWNPLGTREMLTKWNELTWPGAGTHNGCGKIQQTGRGGSGAPHCQGPDNKGSLRRRQGKIYSEVQRRKEAMVRRFNEGNLDQRYGKKKCIPAEISLSMEIC